MESGTHGNKVNVDSKEAPRRPPCPTRGCRGTVSINLILRTPIKKRRELVCDHCWRDREIARGHQMKIRRKSVRSMHA